MPIDLTYELAGMNDTTELARDGTVLRQVRVTFYLGKLGPFYERFDKATMTDADIRARVDALRQTILRSHS